MTNVFLKINKDLFNLGLSPIEILTLAQVMEFNTNTGDCFISDKSMAEAFGVSDKTISRTLAALEEKGFITRDTKSSKGGKVRHILLNSDVIEQALATDKMSIENNSQQTNCPLATDKMSFGNGQNDLIKDKIKENQKDNLLELAQANSEKTAQAVFSNKPVEAVKGISLSKLEAYFGGQYKIINNYAYINDGRIFKISKEG